MNIDRELLSAWRRPDATIPTLFREAARRHPDRAALVDGATSLTYAELDRESDLLAVHLRALGVTAGSVVGLYLPKSHLYMIAGLAAFKAGGAILHLDAAYTADTVRHVIAENAVALVLSVTAMSERPAAAGSPHVVLLDVCDWRGRDVASLPPPTASPSDVAIVGYTSGTTGYPKGVVVPHLAVIYAACKFWEEIADVSASDRFGYVTYLAWDAVSPLIVGATGVILSDDSNRDAALLRTELARYGVNHAVFTPTLLAKLLRSAPRAELRAALAALRVAWVGGEVVEPALIGEALDALPDLRLYNIYGPTECYVVSQGELTRRDADATTGAPTGHVLPELEFLLLDGSERDVTASGEGFLYVGGPALARGYVNLPELTSKRFVTRGGRTFFATGDYCRLLADGRLAVLSRESAVVCASGRQVPLFEVEQSLRRAGGLKDCVAIKSGAGDGRTELLVYCIPGDPDDASAAAMSVRLSSSLRQLLPSGIDAVRWFVIDDVPIHPVSHKINYSALLLLAGTAACA